MRELQGVHRTIGVASSHGTFHEVPCFFFPLPCSKRIGRLQELQDRKQAAGSRKCNANDAIIFLLSQAAQAALGKAARLGPWGNPLRLHILLLRRWKWRKSPLTKIQDSCEL